MNKGTREALNERTRGTDEGYVTNVFWERASDGVANKTGMHSVVPAVVNEAFLQGWWYLERSMLDVGRVSPLRVEATVIWLDRARMCTSDTDQNLSVNLRSTIPFLTLSRTPEDAYRNAPLLSETKATIYVFYHEQAEFSLLRGPPSNSIDVFANDVGFVATVNEKEDPSYSTSLLGVGWV